MVSSNKMVGDTASIGTPAGLGYRAEVPFGQTTLSWTRSYKKDDQPLLLMLTGAMCRCSREKVLKRTQKRELESPL
jgi:hypothetical protein